MVIILHQTNRIHQCLVSLLEPNRQIHQALIKLSNHLISPCFHNSNSLHHNNNNSNSSNLLLLLNKINNSSPHNSNSSNSKTGMPILVHLLRRMCGQRVVDFLILITSSKEINRNLNRLKSPMLMLVAACLANLKILINCGTIPWALLRASRVWPALVVLLINNLRLGASNSLMLQPLTL